MFGCNKRIDSLESEVKTNYRFFKHIIAEEMGKISELENKYEMIICELRLLHKKMDILITSIKPKVKKVKQDKPRKSKKDLTT